MPDAVNGEDIKALADVEIKVVGNAIQRAGFENAYDAWISFDAQLAEENGA